jgi:protein SCO1
MKTKVILLSISGLTLLAISVALSLGHFRSTRPLQTGEDRVFQVRGQILAVDAAEKTLRIAHEEIPNYMPAMAMPLSVKDWAVVKGIAAGDTVQFELRVTPDDSWIARLEKIPAEAAITQPPGTSPPSLEALEAERVRAGERVPDFTLLDQEGKTIHLQDFRGKAVLLTFIYTRCPLPNFCPLMSKNFAELQQRLSKEFPGKYHLLSVSMDPEFDRPEVLLEYAARYDAKATDWSFATGDASAIQFVAGLVGLYFQKENGLISHDLRTALIGPDGRLVHLWKSNVWTPYELQRAVRETLTGSEDFVAR